MSGRGLRYVYVIWGVGEVTRKRQAWGPRVPISWLQDLDNCDTREARDFDDWLSADLGAIASRSEPVPAPPCGSSHPVATTLVVGDLNAVIASQIANENNLERQGVTKGAGD